MPPQSNSNDSTSFILVVTSFHVESSRNFILPQVVHLISPLPLFAQHSLSADVWQNLVIATQPDQMIGRKRDVLSVCRSLSFLPQLPHLSPKISAPLKRLGQKLNLPVTCIPLVRSELKTWKVKTHLKICQKTLLKKNKFLFSASITVLSTRWPAFLEPSPSHRIFRPHPPVQPPSPVQGDAHPQCSPIRSTSLPRTCTHPTSHPEWRTRNRSLCHRNETSRWHRRWRCPRSSSCRTIPLFSIPSLYRTEKGGF